MSAKIKSVAILAGEGALPLQLTRYCIENDIPACIVQFEGCDYDAFPDVPTLKTRIEKVGAIFGFLKTNQVTDVVMVGNLSRPSLKSLRPDWQGIKTLGRIAGAFTKGDNNLLTSLRSEIEGQGFTVRGVDYYLTHLTANAGCLTTQSCSGDVAGGVAESLRHGREDKGQSILMHVDGTYSYEGRAGTTALIEEWGKAGSILFKMMKPNQDPDLDRPTVGLNTLTALQAKECAGMVIEANAVLMVDKDDMIAFANANQMFIEAVHV